MKKNSVSLTGFVTKVGGPISCENKRRVQYFDIVLVSKFINASNEEIEISEFFTIKLRNDQIDQYADIVKMKNRLSIDGVLSSYINKNSQREIIVLPSDIVDLTNEKSLFDESGLSNANLQNEEVNQI